MNLLDFTLRQLTGLVVSWGYRPVHAARLWRYLYRQCVADVDSLVELPPRLRQRLANEASLTPLALSSETRSDAGLTRKYLLALSDGQNVETVLMRMPGRATACLSSQVGCPLGCVFCATGQMGFDAQSLRRRDRGPGRVRPARAQRTGRSRAARFNSPPRRTAPPIAAQRCADGHGRTASELRCGDDGHRNPARPGGISIGAKQTTLSTVGVVPGMVRLADERRPVSLAVSLHAATQEDRAKLVPAAAAWPLDQLMEACRYYTARLGRRIFFEWTLVEGQNDSAEHAHALARLIDGIPAQVNLIPLNPTLGYAGRSGSREAADRFRASRRLWAAGEHSPPPGNRDCRRLRPARRGGGGRFSPSLR